MTKTIIKFWSC